MKVDTLNVSNLTLMTVSTITNENIKKIYMENAMYLLSLTIENINFFYNLNTYSLNFYTNNNQRNMLSKFLLSKSKSNRNNLQNLKVFTTIILH
jgi:hypothetical protein